MSAGLGAVSSAIRQPPFLAAVLALGAATVLAGQITRLRGAFRKAAVPLRKPFSEFDQTSLAGYEFKAAPTLDKAVVNVLGVTEYANWQFIDTSVRGSRDPLGQIGCFITYNTGRPSLVPHVPDNCMLGHGYEIKESGNLTMEMGGVAAERQKVPVRAVTFVKSDVFERAEPTVVYTFHCNGKFLNTRTQVRTHLGNPFDRGAYFCKIEVTFGGPNCAPRYCTREQSLEASEKFLSQLLPVLLRDHLPDWEAVQHGKPTA